MKKTRRSDEQIAFALKPAETGTLVAEVIRRKGISVQTRYRWKVHGGLGVGELRRLKLLEEENRKLQAAGRDLSLDALVESANGRLWEECLNTRWFLSLADARAKIAAE